jgi:uncharacterized protein
VRTIFADTQYWVALINPRDRLHQKALALRRSLRGIPLLTTDGVIAEILAFCSDRGPVMRADGAALVRDIFAMSLVEVVDLTRALVLAGLDLYEQRPDKEYSLIDCISMHLMRERSIHEVLTYDHHFEQEGFVVLLRD